MPNWCINRLSVSGSQPAVNAWLTYVRPVCNSDGAELNSEGYEHLDFNRIITMPECLEMTRATFIGESIYREVFDPTRMSPYAAAAMIEYPREFASLIAALKSHVQLQKSYSDRELGSFAFAALSLEPQMFAVHDIYADAIALIPRIPAKEFLKYEQEALRHRDNAQATGFIHANYWREAKWGTKSNAVDPEDERYNNLQQIILKSGRLLASLRFMTAWNPPHRLFEFAAAKWPDLNFRMQSFEPNMRFKWRMHACRGQVIENESNEY